MLAAILLRSKRLGLASLVAVSACTTTTETPDPVIDPSTGRVADPRNLTLRQTSAATFHSPGGVDEDFVLDVTTLVTDQADNGAEVYNDIAYSQNDSARLSYDADTDRFTITMRYTDNNAEEIRYAETFAPLVLIDPTVVSPYENGIDALWLAYQPLFFAFGTELSNGDPVVADNFLTSLTLAEETFTGFQNISTWVSVANDTGVAETVDVTGEVTSPRVVGSLPLLVANDPATFEAPSGLAGDVEAAEAYLTGLSRDDFIEAQGDAPTVFSYTDALLTELLALSPTSFGLNLPEGAFFSTTDAEFLIETMESVGFTAIADVQASIETSITNIDNSPAFVFASDSGNSQYFQYRMDGSVVPTDFVATGEFRQYDPETGRTEHTHIVFGARTAEEEMPITGTADYTGTLYGTLLRANTTDALRGGFNFATNFLTGRMDINGTAQIAFNNSEGVTEFIDYAGFTGLGFIDGAEFDGTLDGVVAAGQETNGLSNISGTFDGRYYGPTAQEAGGLMEMSNGAIALTGAFTAARDEEE